MKNTIKITLFLAIIFSSIALAQFKPIPDSVKTYQTSDSAFVMTKSPWRAVLRSAVIPGWGQFYNEAYWKIPIFTGAIIGLVYGWRFYDIRYNDYRDLYSQSITNNSGSGNSAFLQRRDFYRDQRDLISIYMGLTYLLNLVDAYVDAQLFDFTVKENVYTLSPEFKMKFYFNR